MQERHWQITDNRYKYKSEYLYEKILLLKAKKTYCGYMSVQEGFKIPMEYDEKNLNKTSYSVASKAFIQELTEEIVSLTKTEIDYAAVFNLVVKHKNNIVELIINGDTSCGTPKKYKSKAEYDDPFGQSTFVGGEIYNVFYHEDAFVTGEEFSSFDLVTPKIGGGKSITEEMRVNTILSFYYEFLPNDKYAILYDIMVNNTYPEMRAYFLKNNGIPYIGFRKTKNIEVAFKDLISVEDIIMKNIDSRGQNFLEAIGIYTDSKTGATEITNIVEF